MDNDENRVFRHGVICHKVLGIWPENDQPLGKYSRIKGYVITASVVIIWIFQYISLIKAPDIDIMLE